MGDPAGWYPDPTGKHEVRYWDGYVWLDSVSDAGVAGTDELGGEPLAAPSDVAAKKSASTSSAGSKSKTPLILATAVAAVVVLIVVGFVTTRGGGKSGVRLGDKPLTFTDSISDVNHLPSHVVTMKGNQAVLIDVSSDNNALSPLIIIEVQQALKDSVDSQIEGAETKLNNQLRSVFSDLREEDIGVKGDVVYFSAQSQQAGKPLHAVMFVPVQGDFDVVPALADTSLARAKGNVTVTITGKPFDLSSVSDLDGIKPRCADPDLSDFHPDC